MRKENAEVGTVMTKTIISVVGHDAVGIIARVCTYLAENNINILDISQTITGGYFNMMMITDTTNARRSSGETAEELAQIGREMNLSIRCMQEDIFDAMHRI